MKLIMQVCVLKENSTDLYTSKVCFQEVQLYMTSFVAPDRAAGSLPHVMSLKAVSLGADGYKFGKNIWRC